MDDQFKRVGHIATGQTTFKTPEQVAASDDQQTASPLINTSRPPEDTVPSKKPKHKLKFWPPNKLTWIILAIVVILLAALGYWYFAIHKTSPKNTPIQRVEQVPKSQTVASSLTGLQVSPATNKLPITAVMVENSLEARPQSGLGEAGVVFEALAEGGITRFVALYQSSSSTSIGPVRSARPYFISWIMGFDAAYAHVGGSPEAETDISQWDVRDLDQYYNSNYYQRISSRQAPHNVYTTPAELYKLEQSKGYTSSSFTSWPRKTASPLKTPTATSIDLNLSGSDYNVSYAYNSSTNSYARNDGGSPQVDADTNKQISVPVAIAIVVPESNGPLDSSGAYYSEYQTVGSGAAYIFQDGGVTVGQWSKSSNSSQILFTTNSGKPIPLDPGEVWITAVTSDSAVSYK